MLWICLVMQGWRRPLYMIVTAKLGDVREASLRDLHGGITVHLTVKNVSKLDLHFTQQPLTGPVSKTSYNPWPWTPECESMIPMQFTTVIATWWCIKTNIQNAGTEEENWNGMQLDHSPHRRLGRGRTPTFLEGSITEVGCIRKHIPIPDWLCIWRTLIPLTRFSVYTVNLHFFSVSLPI